MDHGLHRFERFARILSVIRLISAYPCPIKFKRVLRLFLQHWLDAIEHGFSCVFVFNSKVYDNKSQFKKMDNSLHGIRFKSY